MALPLVFSYRVRRDDEYIFRAEAIHCFLRVFLRASMVESERMGPHNDLVTKRRMCVAYKVSSGTGSPRFCENNFATQRGGSCRRREDHLMSEKRIDKPFPIFNVHERVALRIVYRFCFPTGIDSNVVFREKTHKKKTKRETVARDVYPTVRLLSRFSHSIATNDAFARIFRVSAKTVDVTY